MNLFALPDRNAARIDESTNQYINQWFMIQHIIIVVFLYLSAVISFTNIKTLALA